MTITIRGPVGKVLPGSLSRSRAPTNFADDQQHLVDAFKVILTRDGGQKGLWNEKSFTFPVPQCNSDLADAILSFQQFWKARGVFRNIDGVIDPGGHTLGKMNEIIDDGNSKALKADVIVRFIGGTIQRPLEPFNVLSPVQLKSAYQTFKPEIFKGAVLQRIADDKLLFLIGRTTNTIAQLSTPLFNDVMLEINVLTSLTAARLDRIYVHGSSSGGRNSIDFGLRLPRLGFPRPRFVGAVDAAFFDADSPVIRPDDNAPRIEPRFEGAQNISGFTHNFYQTRGNHKKSTKFGFGPDMFTSSMHGEEIHCVVNGFLGNHNLDSLMPAVDSDDGFHLACSTEGNRQVQVMIGSDLLGG